MGQHVTDTNLWLSSAHQDWSRRLTELSAVELREHARHIVESADKMAIWERGGYVPLQPFILSAKSRRQLHEVGAGLQRLRVDYAMKRANGDLNRLADIVAWDPEERWFLGTDRPLADAVVAGRADVFVSGGRPYFLEINVGTTLSGATAASVLSTTLLGSPVSLEMADTHSIRASSYVDELVQWIRRRYTGKPSNVALVAYDGDGNEGSLKWADEHASRFAPHGFRCDFVPISEADVVDGSLVWQGRRYEIAIRYFMVKPDSMNRHLDFFHALENATDTILIGSYVGQLFTSKALGADIYQDDRLTASERRLLDHVPWIARLKEGVARRGEERVDPVDWASRNRERAVLKPTNLYGSRGVVIGEMTTESDWHSAIEKAVRDGGFIVQELVRPDAWTNMYWHVESEELVDVSSPVLLGPFTIGGADGGCYTRHPIKGKEFDLLDSDSSVSLGCVMSA